MTMALELCNEGKVCIAMATMLLPYDVFSRDDHDRVKKVSTGISIKLILQLFVYALVSGPQSLIPPS